MLCGLMCQQVSVLPPGCRPATAAEGQGCDGAETPTGYESLPPTTSLSAFVPLSRTIMSPAWLCRRPRMVGTGRGGEGGLQVGARGGSVWGERGWVLSSLGRMLLVPAGRELWASLKARCSRAMLKMEVLDAVGVLPCVLAARGRGGRAPRPSTERGAQGAPSLQAWGTAWCWRSTTTRRCTVGT